MEPRNDSGDKQKLRSAMRAKRLSLSEDERTALSNRACVFLHGSPEWESAAVVVLYMAVRGEADCGPLLRDAWARGKTVLLPRCSGQKQGEMRLLPCSGPEGLQPGAYSIPEPVLDEAALETLASGLIPKPDLIVVPGLAFDRLGNRLGMGGGYYDRLLSQPAYAGCFSVGFAYSFQIVEHVQTGGHDIPVRALCTDSNLIRITDE